jgi:hypothetical protein
LPAAYGDARRWQKCSLLRIRSASTARSIGIFPGGCGVEEPGRDTAELASIVADLAAVMERMVDDPFLPELRKRAEALAARLR